MYRFARQFFEERVALLAVFFSLSAPLLAGLSRLFLVEYGLTALVMWTLVALARWDETRRERWLLAVGAFCGLGLLMKITFPLFAGPVVAVLLLRAHAKRPGRLLADVLLIALPAVLLAGPWYAHNWESVTRRSFEESYFAPVHPTERLSPLGAAFEYGVMIVNEGLSAVHVVAAGAGLAAWAILRRDNFLRGSLVYVIPWLVSLPVFALSENRDLRLIAPMFPALALATAALFDTMLDRRPRRWLIAGALAGAGFVTLVHSFSMFSERTLRLGRWQILSPTIGYAFRPNPQHWPLAEVIERIAHRERLGPGSRLIAGLGADTWSFNSNNLDLQAVLLKYPFEFYTTAYTASTDEIRRLMSRTQYFLVKEGGTQQPLDRFRSGSRTLDFLLHGPLFREVEPAIGTPDGGRIRIFENASAGPDAFISARQPPALPELPKADLNFGNQLRVTGLRATEKDGLFTLALRWRSVNPAAGAYRVFVHIVDQQGMLLGSMDHEILHASPPVREWQPGDEGYEARYLVLPAAAARGGQLRLGLFDPETRLRVPLWASTLPLKDDYTAAVVEPNQPPGEGYRFQMEPAPIVACNVEFEGGLRLTGYSLARSAGAVWVRLRWSAPRRPRGRLRFFGHAVSDQSAETPILLSFDQDLTLDNAEVVQDILRDATKLPGGAQFLRAGVFDLDQPLDRFAIRASNLPLNRQQKAIYLPLPLSPPPAPRSQ
ncbi:MAG: glycosyltransferase family 39 protein [Acidobacteria bacterium]|nr:glycosyltransferase family 39 protein [Acidobacteriota bacterium]